MRACPGPGSAAGSSITVSTSGPPKAAAITVDAMPVATSPPEPVIPAALGSPLSLLVAAGAGTPLALVHRLYPGDRDRVALVDQIGAQRLRRWHLRCPRITAGEQGWRGVHSEVGRRHAVEVIPGHREGHRHAGPGARAV